MQQIMALFNTKNHSWWSHFTTTMD